MKPRARIIGLTILGFLIAGAAWPGHDGPRLLGQCELCPLFPDEVCIPAPQRDLTPPIVTVKVRVPAFAVPGKNIVYKICIENCSSAEAHHVMVRNPLPANAKFVKADPAPVQKEPELVWKLGTIGGGACREIDLVLAPTDKEDVKNCTRVQFEHGTCVTTRLSGYPFGGTGEPGVPTMPPVIEPDPKITPIPPEDDAKLTLTIQGPAKQYTNLAARYFITVTNTGKAPATNLLVTAFLPEKSKFVKASEDGRFALQQVAWLLGTLKPGATRTVEVEMKALAAGELCIKAAALADRGIAAKAAELCTIFGGASAVGQETTVRDGPIAVGQETSYKIVVENQGFVPVTNLQVTGNISPLMSFTLAKAPVGHKLGDVTPKGQIITFETIPAVEPGKTVTLEVFAKGLKAGDARFRIAIIADQLKEGGPVQEETSTTIYTDDGAPRGRLLSRRKIREE